MDWKKLHYLIWFLPAYLLFQGIYQVIVYNGMIKTYAEGTSYMANVDYFRINDMQAQTNGVIILSFTTKDGQHIRQKMTLAVQLAEEVRDYNKIPVRYLKDSSMPIIMIPPYSFDKNMVKINIAICVVSFLITLGIAVYVEKYFGRKKRGEVPDGYVFEMAGSRS